MWSGVADPPTTSNRTKENERVTPMQTAEEDMTS